MELLLNDLLKINGGKNAKECEYYLDALNIILPEYKINTKERIAHFLAQVLHESGHLKHKEENLNYSAEGLLTTFKKYFDNRDLADLYARKPERIANRVYANRMGNGDEASGDGWRYRGRGLIQLTGKQNYVKYTQYSFKDFVREPHLVNASPEESVEVACWFWQANKLNDLVAQGGDVSAVTRRVNGGVNGLADRQKIYKVAMEVLK